MQKAIGNNTLASKVLRCVDPTLQETAEEIRTKYLRLYPPSKILSKFVPSISITEIEAHLRFLTKEGYVHREVTRFTDRPLSGDTCVFKTTQKGFAVNVGR